MDTIAERGAGVDPAAALARIPGWEDGRCEPLHGGETNNAWLVTGPQGRAVLKLDPATRETPFAGRIAESRVQQTAAAAGLAPAVLHADETVLLTVYVDGRAWTRDSFSDPAALEQLAVQLRALHRLPLTGRTFDAWAAARSYADRLVDADRETVADHLRVIRAMPKPQNLCCCHNDLVAANIVSTPGIVFIDWEYACDNDPFFDLATIVAHHRLSTPQSHALLDAYFDGDGERWRPQLAASERLYNALLWLWRAALEKGSDPFSDKKGSDPF